MGVIADMIRAGIDADMVERVALEMVETARHGLPARTSRQERNARYYEKHGKYRPRGDDWNEIRQLVFERDGWTCVYCGTRDDRPHCDHVVPVSRGGSHETDNLVTACGSCNSSKNNRRIEEWVAL